MPAPVNGFIAFIGDTPANNHVGGFKESVSMSFRICRQCLATNQDVQEKVSSSYFFSTIMSLYLKK